MQEKLLLQVKIVSLIRWSKLNFKYPAKISPESGCSAVVLPAFPCGRIGLAYECTIFRAGGIAAGYLRVVRRCRIYR